MYRQDTIAAIATAPGNGGIGIIRMSGPDAEKYMAISNKNGTKITDPKTLIKVDSFKEDGMLVEKGKKKKIIAKLK